MSPSMMRAVAVEEFGPPQNLRLVDRPIPEPDEGEVSVDVEYAGVGFVDTMLRSGAFPLGLPFVPGIEVTGRIRAVGPGVEGLASGQPAAALLNDFGRTERAGGYAEVAVAHHLMVAPLPEDADFKRITAVISNGVAAWIALHHLAGLKQRDRVLVLGVGGGLGAITARLAALHPAALVVGVVGRDPERGPAECSEVVIAEELDARLDELSEDGAVDVVIDPVGGALRTTAFNRLAPFGRHLILGNASGDDPPISGNDAWLNTRTLSGLNVGGTADLRPGLVSDALAAVTTLVVRGALREPEPAIEPLARASVVHEAIEERSAPSKSLLSIQS